MFKKVSFIILFCFFTNVIYSQPQYEWAIGVGSSSFDYGQSIDVDSEGNIYCGGFFRDSVDFDPGLDTNSMISNGGEEAFIQKISPSGDLIWVKGFGGVHNDKIGDLEVDFFGDIVVTGSYRNTVDFDPNAGVNNQSSNGLDDVFISKLDSAGNHLWTKCYGGIIGDYIYGLATDVVGNIYVTGVFNDTVDFESSGTGSELVSSPLGDDIFVLKLDVNGNLIWAKQIGGPGRQHSSDLTLDIDGNILITGMLEEVVDFDPGPGMHLVTSAGDYDGFTVKLNQDGEFLWVNKFDPVSGSYGLSVTTDQSGGVYTAGFFVDSVDFDPGPGVDLFISAGHQDVFVNKTDSSGNYLWTKQIGGIGWENCHVIRSDTSQGIYLGGFFESSGLDFNPDIGSDTASPVAYRDAYIIKIDTSGDYRWSIQMGGGYFDEVLDLTVANNADLLSTGYYEFTVDFDPTSGVDNIIANGVYFDVFVQKLSLCESDTIIFNVSTLPDITDGCIVNSISPPTAISGCGETLVGTTTTSFPIVSKDTTVVTWTFDDYNGNLFNQDQLVIISDTTFPVGDPLPSIQVNCIDDIPVSDINSIANVSDNCSVPVVAFVGDVSDGNTCPMTITRTYSVVDAAGNELLIEQIIMVEDTVPPIPDNPVLPTLTFECEASPAPPIALDCNDTIDATSNVLFPITQIGTNQVTWSYIDSCGNTSTQIQDIVVVPLDSTISISSGGDTLIAMYNVGSVYQWIDCDNGNSPISGATSQTYAPLTNGNYAVNITNGNCSTSSDCFSFVYSGTEVLNSGVFMYPNPTLSHSYLKSKIPITYSVRSVDGVVISETKKMDLLHKINLDIVSSGVYIVEIKSVSGMVVTKRLIKN